MDQRHGKLVYLCDFLNINNCLIFIYQLSKNAYLYKILNIYLITNFLNQSRQLANFLKNLLLLRWEVIELTYNLLLHIKKMDTSDQDQKMLSDKLFQVEEKNVKSLLHRSICSIRCLNKAKKDVCGSGILISKNLVLSCAHNFYERKHNDKYHDIKVSFGDNGSVDLRENIYQVQVEDVYFMNEYKDSEKKDRHSFDVALLKLKKQVEYEQFLKISLPCKICLMNNNKQIYLDIFGFPIQSYNNSHQFKIFQYGLRQNNRIVGVNQVNNKIYYGISTQKGQSGCPVVMGQQIIAIHIGSGLGENQILSNLGRYFDLQLIIQLQNWCKRAKAHPFTIYNKEDLCPHIKPIVKDYLREKQAVKLEKNFSNKGLTEIKLLNEINLTHLSLDSNQFSSINTAKNLNLVQLNLSNNRLFSINLATNINLTQLNLSNNQLYVINLTKNINLVKLNLSYNQLSTIDVSNNINLSLLNLANNKLSEINITKNINLASFNIGNNFLFEIDVTKNLNLVELRHGDNQLFAIDVEKNIYLTDLDLSNNSLVKIDITKNICLTGLFLNNNQISTIDITKNIHLTWLSISNNKLSALNAIKNINLARLILENNKIAKMSLVFSTQLISYYSFWFNFSNQQSIDCDVQIQYNNKDEVKCNKVKQEWKQKYGQQNKPNNQYGCKYTFTPIKQ